MFYVSKTQLIQFTDQQKEMKTDKKSYKEYWKDGIKFSINTLPT